jgi:hypothetical protein
MLKFIELLEDFVYPDAKVVDFKGIDIFVKQYLPAEEKYQLLYACVQGLDLLNKPYNPLVADLLFDLEVVQSYSSINFGDNQETYFKVFDVLQMNGLIDLVIGAIPVGEYEEMKRLYEESIESAEKHAGNTTHAIQAFLKGLPSLSEEVEAIDPEALEKAMKISEKLSNEGHI